MNGAAIPREPYRITPGNPTAEGTVQSCNQSDCIEPPHRVVQGDFITIVPPPLLQHGEPKRRAGINQIPEVGVPTPGSRCAIRWELSEEAVVGGQIASQSGSEDVRIAISGQQWVYGEQKPASQREEEQRAEGAQPRRRAGADGSHEAGSGQAEPQEDVSWPDDKSGGAPATEDRSEAQYDEGTQDQPEGDEKGHRRK